MGKGMTDERRLDDRRSEDVRLADEVRAHLESEYAQKDHNHAEIHRLIEALEGRSHVMPSGRVHYEGGLINEVAMLTAAMRNGGFKIKIPIMGWVAIVVAIIAGLFQVVSVVVGSG